MGWTVRRAVPADAGRIAEIDVTGWQAAYRGLVPDSYLDGMRLETQRERWSLGLRTYLDPATMFVAVDEKGVIRSYALVRPARRDTDRHPMLETGELCAIYADPAWRGTGAGFAAHQAAMGHLAAYGFRHAVLWVLTGNAPSRRFYERRGWKCDEVVHELTIGGEQVPEVRYSRSLQGSRT